MSLNLADYENKAREAIKSFWASREAARQRQIESGRTDQGERAGVTAGKNMDGFVSLIADVVRANGLEHADIHRARRFVTLPGFFRPTKLWDILVMDGRNLIAAIELKSHVGPSFGNNFNNRAEEAIGTSHDFRIALREGALAGQAMPFVGWILLVEDARGSRNPVRDASPHYPVFAEFQGASYLRRYDLLCQRLMREQLYTAACVLTSPREAIDTGNYGELSSTTSLTSFITSLAAQVAAAAARHRHSDPDLTH